MITDYEKCSVVMEEDIYRILPICKHIWIPAYMIRP